MTNKEFKSMCFMTYRNLGFSKKKSAKYANDMLRLKKDMDKCKSFPNIDFDKMIDMLVSELEKSDLL